MIFGSMEQKGYIRGEQIRDVVGYEGLYGVSNCPGYQGRC